MFSDRLRKNREEKLQIKRRPTRTIWRLDPAKVEGMVKRGIPEEMILQAGPKRQWKWDLYEEPGLGWRSTFTKPSLKDRKEKRRRKEKNRRRVNAQMRRR